MRTILPCLRDMACHGRVVSRLRSRGHHTLLDPGYRHNQRHAPHLQTLTSRKPFARWNTGVAAPQTPVEEQLREEKLTADDIQHSRGHFTFTTTNSLKLVMPMPNKKDVVAFLLHTQQPLSYLETLIRNELPTSVAQTASIQFFDIERDARWSTSIQVSDFIREAAALKKFCIDIKISETAVPIEVNVPSFEDRTQFLRARLGTLTNTLQQQYLIKSECDQLAKNTARRYALMGMGGLVTYWVVVFQLTFFTSLGWDTMEPATYLCGLSALISGYCWFLYHNRDVSYSSVLHTAATVRQQRLYHEKGFDIIRWRDLIEEGKELRKDIQRVADEYNVEWTDAGDKYISNSSADASKVLAKEQQKEASNEDRGKAKSSSRKEDLEDDGVINGSNEDAPTKNM